MAAAQNTPVEIEPSLTESGAAYDRTIRWQRLQTNVQYYDPDAPAPPVTRRARTSDRDLQTRWDRLRPPTARERTVGIVLTAAIIAVIVLLVLRFGSFSALGFGGQDETTREDRESGTGSVDASRGPLGFADILAIQDRAVAVHALLAAVLAKAADDLGLTLHPSWTARDILRRIPADWALDRALGDLTQVAEEAHFGGRQITEEEFNRVAQRIAPLFEGKARV
ncbi:MAG: DUF4129 domain-containing protein [Pseudomonadota bacterium]